MKKENWVWMPHVAHHICGEKMHYSLATYVGGYVVSTVGDYYPNGYYSKLGNKNQKDTVGHGRFYETMVFRAKKSDQKCCGYDIATGENVDFQGYSTAQEATKGHYLLCKKWAQKCNHTSKEKR